MSHSRDLLAQLVRFDTTSRESNLALIDFVRTYLQGHGVACELVFNEHKNKANLLATIGPADVPGIVLSGHTDGCRWTASAGAWRHSTSANKTASCTGVAPPT